ELARGAEAGLEVAEEVEVDVGALVGGAVEGADRRGGPAAAGVDGAGEERQGGGSPTLDVLGGPEVVLQAAHDRPHEVLQLVVGLAAGARLDVRVGLDAAGGGAELAEDVAGVDAGAATAAAGEHGDEGDDDGDDPATTGHGHATAADPASPLVVDVV